MRIRAHTCNNHATAHRAMHTSIILAVIFWTAFGSTWAFAELPLIPVMPCDKDQATAVRKVLAGAPSAVQLRSVGDVLGGDARPDLRAQAATLQSFLTATGTTIISPLEPTTERRLENLLVELKEKPRAAQEQKFNEDLIGISEPRPSQRHPVGM